MRSTVDHTRRAATLGPEAPTSECPARVHSVFRAAANLKLSDGALLTLLSLDGFGIPFGVRLSTIEDFDGLGLEVGDAGVVRPDAIVIERSNGRRPFQVDCATAKRLAAPPLPPLRGNGANWRAGVALLEALQERAATDLRVAPLLRGARSPAATGRRLAHAACDLGRAVRTGEFGPMRDAAARLVGLGQGLTPAGDDFLCGFAAAAHCRCAARPALAPHLAQFADAVRERLDQTTEISAAFLRSALVGRLSEPLAELIEACAGGGENDVEGAVARLARVGHSSGLDAATGFFYGAAAFGGVASWGAQLKIASMNLPRVCGGAEPRRPAADDNWAQPAPRPEVVGSGSGAATDQGGRTSAEGLCSNISLI